MSIHFFGTDSKLWTRVGWHFSPNLLAVVLLCPWNMANHWSVMNILARNAFDRNIKTNYATTYQQYYLHTTNPVHHYTIVQGGWKSSFHSVLELGTQKKHKKVIWIIENLNILVALKVLYKEFIDLLACVFQYIQCLQS